MGLNTPRLKSQRNLGKGSPVTPTKEITRDLHKGDSRDRLRNSPPKFVDIPTCFTLSYALLCFKAYTGASNNDDMCKLRPIDGIVGRTGQEL